MAEDSRYSVIAQSRIAGLRTRLIGAGVISTAAMIYAPSVLPLMWLALTLAIQWSDHRFCLAYLRRAANRPPSQKEIAMMAAMTAVNVTVYSSITIPLWTQGGEIGRLFAVIMLCGALLHVTMQFYAVRTLLLAAIIPHMTYLVGYLIAIAVQSGQQGLLPVAILLVAAALYATHLGTVVRKANSALRELAEANQREAAARLDAEAASAAKSAFVATLTHEIRTPMNAVISARHFLEASAINAEQREHVAMLRDASEVMLGLMNDVLDMAKIEAGRMVIESTPVDLGGLCDSLIRLWTPAARQKGLGLRFQCEAPLPPVVLTDPLRLRQILSNLISNAIKFTETGDVTLSIRPSQGLGGSGWEFRVQDQGCGMSPDVLNHLFEPFTQASVQTARTHGGTGLGLTISLGLARLMGGDIRVDSTPGAGSCFTVELPLIEAVSSPLGSPTVRVVDQQLTPVGLRVLIAEDHAVNRRILELLLSPLGWHLTLAHDGAEAVAAADLQTFDVILMDMQMPVMDGVSATKTLRMGNGPNKDTPVIALTANALDSHKALWAEAGVEHFLTKPIDPPKLIDTMLSVVNEIPEDRSAVLSKIA